MFRYVEDKEYLKRAYSVCADIVNQLVQKLKKYDIEASMNLVGSGRRNMVTQNEKESIDFDFNLLIENADDWPQERALKEEIKKAFNEVLRANDWDDCDDSTSALTTKERVFTKGNKTPFYVDVCIVSFNRYGQLQRLIHEKTGNAWCDRYYWNPVPDSKELWDKEDYLKPEYWQVVRDTYLVKKNMYIRRPYDHTHPSFVCYIEAVNEVYEKVRRGVI